MPDNFNKQYCLDWLNHRLELHPMKQVSQFDSFDIDFIQSYIYFRKEKEVPKNDIINSIRSYPLEILWGKYLDFMVSWIIKEFNIECVEDRIMSGRKFISEFK